MHSSSIRGTDFKIEWRGQPITHAAFFSQVPDTERVGIFTPQRFEGLGAITLIMAYVTAFYDRYRERGSEFYAYPDFFTFQRHRPCADYGMCDIWPHHKNVQIPDDAQGTAEILASRGVTVLLVPNENARETNIAAVELESFKRGIRRCFAYSGSGMVTSPDLVLECGNQDLGEFALAVLDSVPADNPLKQLRQQWSDRQANAPLRQSFREIELSEALRRI